MGEKGNRESREEIIPGEKGGELKSTADSNASKKVAKNKKQIRKKSPVRGKPPDNRKS